MMTPPLHRWDLSPQAAVALQRDLAQQVIYDTPLEVNTINLVAGVDVSVKDDVSHAAIVVMQFPSLQIIETVTASQPTPFPYITGLLSFREAPVLLTAFDNLQNKPDVYLFDGMGRIHPRRLGIASHMGLWLNAPTIGCGKTHLLGDYSPPDRETGSYTPLIHRGEVLGVVLRTRQDVKPVYISPGHLCNLDSAIQITLACTTKYRLPEPIRAAHNAAGRH
jgi:deoxyribonuclease V